MKFFKNIWTAAAVASLAVLSVGCTDIEDYPDGRITRSEIFGNAKRTAGFLNNCYEYIRENHGNAMGSNTMIASCSDEAFDVLNLQNGAPYQWITGNASAFSNPMEYSPSYWGRYYEGIRYCNIFLANIDNANTFSETERKSFRAQAHGLRAYYYLQLIKRYGGVPIILKEITDNSEYVGMKRNTFAECVRQIIADCREVLNTDEVGWFSGTADNERYKFSKGMACAIMSQAALYAASPLNNDGTFTWNEAAKITKEALDLCTANGYALYTAQPSGDLSYSAYDAYFIRRADVAGIEDKETIMEACNQLSMWSYNGLPTVLGQTKAGSCPSQELVDSYETTDGVMPILGYKDENHLEPIINPAAKLYSEKHPYNNRDPRLRAAIYYNGSSVRVGSSTVVETGEGGNCAISEDNVKNTRTGYYMRKFSSPNSNRTTNQDGYVKVFRLAELYLNYAEAAAEAATGTVPNDAVDAVNTVRARVRMPELAYGMTKDEFRTRLRNERRVEFAFEEQRFYDVRRWKILDQTDRVITGMRPEGKGLNLEYKRFVVVHTSAYTDKYLRFPIPGDEAIRFKSYSGDFQNAGW